MGNSARFRRLAVGQKRLQKSDFISIENYKFYVLGEGIEVEEKNFSEEVASQISNTS